MLEAFSKKLKEDTTYFYEAKSAGAKFGQLYTLTVLIARNPAGDAMRAENGKKMQKFGYRPAGEWNRNMLLSAVSGLSSRGRGVVWRDRSGEAVATETDGTLHIENKVEQRLRDALITCWVAKQWGTGDMKWEEPERGLTRAMSAVG